MKHESKEQPGHFYWAARIVTGTRGVFPRSSPQWCVMSQVIGYPATEAHDDWFGNEADADAMARQLAGIDSTKDALEKLAEDLEFFAETVPPSRDECATMAKAARSILKGGSAEMFSEDVANALEIVRCISNWHDRSLFDPLRDAVNHAACLLAEVERAPGFCWGVRGADWETVCERIALHLISGKPLTRAKLRGFMQ